MAAAPFENRRGNHAYVCRSRLGTYVNIRRIFRGNNKEQAYNLFYDALHRIYRYCNSFAALHNEHKCGKQPKFQYEHPLLLLLVMVIQILVIIFFAYFGNFVYFSINSPEKCCVITTSKYSLNNIVPKIKKYKKQYLITDAILFTNPDLFDIINRCDTVFVYDVPAASRTTIVEYCYANNKNIYYNFEMCDVVSLRGRNAMLDDKPMIASTVKGLTVEQRIMKRAMDLLYLPWV